MLFCVFVTDAACGFYLVNNGSKRMSRCCREPTRASSKDVWADQYQTCAVPSSACNVSAQSCHTLDFITLPTKFEARKWQLACLAVGCRAKVRYAESMQRPTHTQHNAEDQTELCLPAALSKTAPITLGLRSEICSRIKELSRVRGKGRSIVLERRWASLKGLEQTAWPGLVGAQRR